MNRFSAPQDAFLNKMEQMHQVGSFLRIGKLTFEYRLYMLIRIGFYRQNLE